MAELIFIGPCSTLHPHRVHLSYDITSVSQTWLRLRHQLPYALAALCLKMRQIWVIYSRVDFNSKTLSLVKIYVVSSNLSAPQTPSTQRLDVLHSDRLLSEAHHF
jgi:hypothetical protein